MSLEPKTLKTCFEEGVAARASGKQPSENPYCPATDEREEWKEGWRAAPALDEDNDPASDRNRPEDD